MPRALFVRGGDAIHGTFAVGALRRRASRGRIRLAPGHAASRLARDDGGATMVIRN